MLPSEPFWSLCVFFNLNVVCDLHPHPSCEYLFVLLLIILKNNKLWALKNIQRTNELHKKMEEQKVASE